MAKQITQEQRELLMEMIQLGQQAESDPKMVAVLANHLLTTRSGPMLTLELREQIRHYKSEKFIND